MSDGGNNSFFRFTLGFTLFIALSFCITIAVNTIAIAQEKQKQTAAAFQVFIGSDAPTSHWWTVFVK